MEAAALKVISALTEAGPLGVIIAGGLVAVVGLMIVFARSKRLFDDSATDSRVASLQSHLQKEIDRLSQREDALSQALEAQRRLVDQLTAQLSLYREQTRRMIDQIKLLKAGKILPADIEISEGLK